MRDWTISKKIWLGLGLITLNGLAVGLYAFYGLNILNKVNAASEVKQEFLTREIDHLKWVNQLKKDLRDKKDLSVQKDPTQCGLGKWYYGQGRKNAMEQFPAIGELLAKLEEPHKKLHEQAHEIQKMIEEQKWAEAQAVVVSEVEPILAEIQGLLGQVRKSMDEEIARYGTNSSEIAKQFVLIMNLILVLLVVLSGVMGYFLVRSVVSPVEKVLAQVKKVAQSLGLYANKIRDVNENLVATSSSQAAASQETAASVAEIESIAAKNAENGRFVKENADQTLESVNLGYQRVEQIREHTQQLDAMGESLRQHVQDNEQELRTIVQLIQKINERVSSIHEIVFQTKLLSFNASVEAARAGASGAGFAVVAEEVRKLAEMSGQVAHQITELVSSSEQQVKSIIEGTKERFEALLHENQSHLSENRSSVEELFEVFSQIKDQVQKVTDLVSDMAQSNQEQQLGFSEISKAVQNIDSAVQQTQYAIRDSAQVSRELVQEVESLESSVQVLKSFVESNKEFHSPRSAGRGRPEATKRSHPEESTSTPLPKAA